MVIDDKMEIGVSDIDRLRDILIHNGGFEVGSTQIIRLSEHVYKVGDENEIGYFCDENGYIYLNIPTLVSSSLYILASAYSGFIEIQNKDGKYELYSITQIDGVMYPYGLIFLKKKEPIDITYTKGKKVEDNSIETFNARMDIAFFEIYFGFDSFKKPPIKKINEKIIKNVIHIGALRLKDIEFFINRGDVPKSILEDKDIREQLASLINSQVYDDRDRFKKVGDLVQIEELDRYLELGLINECKYVELKSYLETVNEFDDMKGIEEEMIIKGTEGDLGKIK